MVQKLFQRNADVLDDLAQEQGRNIPAGMVRNGRATPVRMAILHLRATLPDQSKTHRLQDAADLARLEDGWLGHGLRGDNDALGADKLGLQRGVAVLKKHLNDLAEVSLQLVQRFALRVSTGKTGHIADVKPGVGAALNDCGKHLHLVQGMVATVSSQRTKERLPTKLSNPARGTP